MQRLAWILLSPLAALIVGCAPRDNPGNGTVIGNSVAASTPIPGAQPVTIGEGGPGISACVARGRIVNLSPSDQPYLPVRVAPFDEAAEIGRLDKGARVFVCTRSLNQAWRGVVIPPADAPDADCGVRAPVAAATQYVGPCRSGWIRAAFVELSAG